MSHENPEIPVEALKSPVEVKRLVDRFQLLLKINANINTTFDTKALLRKIIDMAAVVMNAEASSLALLESATDELVFHLAEGKAGKVVESMRIRNGQGIAGWVAQQGENVIVNDVEHDTRFYKGIDQATRFSTRSIMCVPLIRGERTIGVLQVLNKKDGRFDEEDLALFLSLANIAAIAIENSQLYHLLNQTISQLRDDNGRMNFILDHIKHSDQEVFKVKKLLDQEGSLRGSLAVFAPPNLLQMLANDRKVGALVLENQERSGRIFVNNGRIYHAEMQGAKPHLIGNMAVYEMMSWDHGSFLFMDREQSQAETIQDSCMHLIIEGLRREDELKLLLETYPEARVPRLALNTGLGELQSLSEEFRQVISLATGQASLKEMWQQSTLDRHAFLSAIKDLHESQLLTLN